MSKNYQTDPRLIQDLKQKTEQVEEAYLAKQAKKRQRKMEKEELSQRWVAPLLLLITLLLGFFVSIIFNH